MDTEYVIDSAFSLGQLTALEMAALSHSAGGYNLVRQYVDGNRQMEADFLHNTAREALRASPALTYACAMKAAPAFQAGLEFFEQACEHVVRQAVLENLGHSEPNEFLRMLGQGPLPRYFDQPEDVTEARVRQALQAQMGGLLQRWEEDIGLIRQAVAWASEQPTAELSTRLGLDLAPAENILEEALPTLARAVEGWKQQDAAALRKDQGEKRRLAAKAKGAIKKVSRLFEQMGYRDNLTMFVSGQAIELSHPDSLLKFSLKPVQEQGWLLSRTLKGRHYTPYDLQLLTKTDVHIARLCVYFDETPVLDQVLALSMFIHSGNEEELLLKANWFAQGNTHEEELERLCTAYPKLQNKLKPPPLAVDEMLGIENRVRLPQAFLREEDAWEPYAGRVQQWVRAWGEDARQTLLGMAQELEPLRLQFVQLMEPKQPAQPAPQLLLAA